jgi:hypothetical protein
MFNHHIHVHSEEVKIKCRKKLMQEKKTICRMLPKYYPIIYVHCIYLALQRDGWMMGLLEYVYVDPNEIVAFKLIGSKLLQLSLQSV